MRKTTDFSRANEPSSIAAGCLESQEYKSVSPKRQAWRERVVLERAKPPVRNPAAYLRAALPKFIADEQQEIYQWLVGQLAEYIGSAHPTIECMKLFVTQAAEAHDLALPDSWVECVVEHAYLMWKGTVITSGQAQCPGNQR